MQRGGAFANDQAANLLAVDGPADASKNDDGPGEWMPINRTYRRTYVLRYLQVARKYTLSITAADRDADEPITESAMEPEASAPAGTPHLQRCDSPRWSWD
ncbi:hypothetical protein OG809_33620 [Kribbella soli]